MSTQKDKETVKLNSQTNDRKVAGITSRNGVIPATEHFCAEMARILEFEITCGREKKVNMKKLYLEHQATRNEPSSRRGLKFRNMRRSRRLGSATKGRRTCCRAACKFAAFLSVSFPARTCVKAALSRYG